MTAMLPAIVFLVAIFLAFSTGTSWGTFGILLPIIAGINLPSELLVITVSACLAGAVCGDHCSPISDTTIMSSAGAQCDHMNHVTTQIPYVAVAATVSFIGYCIAGVVPESGDRAGGVLRDHGGGTGRREEICKIVLKEMGFPNSSFLVY